MSLREKFEKEEHSLWVFKASWLKSEMPSMAYCLWLEERCKNLETENRNLKACAQLAIIAGSELAELLKEKAI